ncbi:hypothetical protein KC19_2G031200 [Ceratodon purpureus]|uniref:Coiled-coil domain-containing protein SCD2 n=1 Tax=Ceratodon purpureus TaxID=3225 RepID=A0A8T0IPN6_CERPU|nr:hypothetical protein KC19_2G031200 [Ceratodon purpureus]
MSEMERTSSPALGRQRNGASGPTLLHSRSNSQAGSGSFNSLRRGQNYAAKAAAARLAQVMQANRDFGSDDEDEDDMPHYSSSYLSSVAQADSRREPSPRTTRMHDAAPARPTMESTFRPSANPRGSLHSARPTVERPIQRPTTSVPSALRPVEPAFQRPRPVVTAAPVPLRPVDPAPEIHDRHRKYASDPTPVPVASHDAGGRNSRRESAALLDEIDMLQEDNESLFEKLRLAEEKLAQKDFRTRELERQITAVGQHSPDSSVDSLDSRLRSRKEQFLKQREAALKAAKEHSKDVKDDEIAQLKLEAEAAREEAAAASAAAHEVEVEVKALRTMTHRMILTQEEMEEVVLKRCWLARYWGLAAKHGIHPEIATSKSDFWSSLAPLPLEVVLSAGQRAKEEPSSQNQTSKEGPNSQTKGKTRDVNDITGEGNIESMLAVEKGLRELAALKVEDAVMLALARHRHAADAARDSTDSPRAPLTLELSPMEVEDVQFKQAWLVYFWRRAKTNGLEVVRAENCIQLWISRTMFQTTVRDQEDVERGMMDLRALGVEEKLWNVSRREISKDAANQKVDVLEVLTASNSLQRTLSSTFLQ